MAYQQWMWLFWIVVGAALTITITAQVNRKRLSDCVIVPRNEWAWLVERAAKAPGSIRPITKAEVQQAIDAASEIAQATHALGVPPAVAMDDVLMALHAEGFDGQERRLGVEVDGMLGIEQATYQDYARMRVEAYGKEAAS